MNFIDYYIIIIIIIFLKIIKKKTKPAPKYSNGNFCVNQEKGWRVFLKSNLKFKEVGYQNELKNSYPIKLIPINPKINLPLILIVF